MRYSFNLFLFLFFLSGLFAQGNYFTEESEDLNFSVTKIIGGLDNPWSMAFLPQSQDILITERSGTLFLYSQGELKEIDGLPSIAAIGQGGLLDIVIDRNFSSNHIIYFTFSEKDSGVYGTALAKAVLNGHQLENQEVIFRASPKSSGGIHFGSRLLIDDNNHIYITLGERGVMSNAQDLTHHGGSVIRLNTDGSIPQDNPYGAIYTYGHRNPQGIAFNDKSGEIWIHEHGPKGGDEVNILKAGANYGWPLVTFGINYNGSIISGKTDAPGLEAPILYWIPSIAPSGMAFYNSDVLAPWEGNVFVGALAGKHLRRLVTQGNEILQEEVLLKNRIGRVRDVRTGPDGLIYILTDEKNGALYKLAPEDY